MPRVPPFDPRPRNSAAEVEVRLTSDSLHDLLSPINQVCTLTDLILKRYRGTLDEEAEFLFGLLESSGKRMKDLLAGLRAYTRAVGSLGPYRRCDGNTLLADALASIQDGIDQSDAVVTHDPLPELYCDPLQMSRAFAELIENAIKFRGERQPEVHVSSRPEGEFWVFSFRDNGIGIDPKYGQRIFGMFKRIHSEAYPGAGVGLAAVQQIVERHGGNIRVESELGHGATFLLTLPKELTRVAPN